jgi:LmbE family N-acetylglucosaminyl deacetylase
MTVEDVLARMRALPVRDLDWFVGGTEAMILAPHPDDESLGCGGLIAAACDRQLPPFVVFVTDGAGSHPGSRLFPPDRLRATREAEATAALRELGLSSEHIAFMRLPDTAAPHDGPSFDDAVETIADRAARRRCDCILAPWRNDPHCDHLATHLMAATVASRLGLRHLSFPVWGWTLPGSDRMEETVRGAKLDIRTYLSAKRRAIAAHASQHGVLISDDPDGFCLSAGLLAVFDEPYEVFLENDVA